MGVPLEDQVSNFVGLGSTVGTIVLVWRIVFGSNVLFSVKVGVLDVVTVENVTFLFNTGADKGKMVAFSTVELDGRKF